MTSVMAPVERASEPREASICVFMTRERWIGVERIMLTGLVVLLHWQQLAPIYVLWAAVAIGLYPLVKTGLIDIYTERKIGTEIFVTIATLVAVFGGETVAGAVLMVIILIAEFIADLNTDHARASIKALIGSVPQTAIVRTNGVERTVPISAFKIGEVVLVRTGEKFSGRRCHGQRPGLGKPGADYRSKFFAGQGGRVSGLCRHDCRGWRP